MNEISLCIVITRWPVFGEEAKNPCWPWCILHNPFLLLRASIVKFHSFSSCGLWALKRPKELLVQQIFLCVEFRLLIQGCKTLLFEGKVKTLFFDTEKQKNLWHIKCWFNNEKNKRLRLCKSRIINNSLTFTHNGPYSFIAVPILAISTRTLPITQIPIGASFGQFLW